MAASDALTIQADDNIVAAGSGSRAGAFAGFAHPRYTTRGRLDAIFGRAGKVLTDLAPG